MSPLENLEKEYSDLTADEYPCSVNAAIILEHWHQSQSRRCQLWLAWSECEL
jgi:hypothetical protein